LVASVPVLKREGESQSNKLSKNRVGAGFSPAYVLGMNYREFDGQLSETKGLAIYPLPVERGEAWEAGLTLLLMLNGLAAAAFSLSASFLLFARH